MIRQDSSLVAEPWGQAQLATTGFRVKTKAGPVSDNLSCCSPTVVELLCHEHKFDDTLPLDPSGSEDSPRGATK